MSKEAFYFSHDSNARNDEKILALRMKWNWEGYGLFWALIERLRESADYTSVRDYNVIAYDLRSKSDIIKSIINDFGLFAFTEDGKRFYSERLNETMELKNQKSEKAKKSAKARWDKSSNDQDLMQTQYKCNANALQTQCDSNAKKEKESKVNNNTVDSNNNLTSKLLFVQIKNLNEACKNFQGDKAHLFIAYRFWELWKDRSPNDQTIQKAKVYVWVDEIRKLLKYDKVTTDRLIGIYSYFSQCAIGKTGFRTFWFDTIKSIGGLRKKNKHGEFYVDRIADEVNEQIEKDLEFENLVFTNIEKYKKYATSIKTP